MSELLVALAFPALRFPAWDFFPCAMAGNGLDGDGLFRMAGVFDRWGGVPRLPVGDFGFDSTSTCDAFCI